MGRAASSTVVTVAGALSLLLAGGCDPTEVVVIADTDMTLFVDFDTIQFRLPDQFGPQAWSSRALPATMGFLPGEGGRQMFDIVVSLNKDNSVLPLVSRHVSHIPFEEGEMRAVFVKLLAQCLCDGTTCPHALDEACRDIPKPEMTEFDEDNLPRLQAQAP